MGLALLVVIWLITLVSTYFFAAHTWWLPAGASSHAAALDRQFNITYLFMGVVFVAAQVALGLFVWKYRDRRNAPEVAYSHGSTKMEITWTALTAVMFVGLNLVGHHVWAESRFEPVAANAIKVEVTGLQFAWYFRYPGADGKFGAVKAELIDPSLGGAGAVGLDTDDPAAGDDVVTGTMVLPVNRDVDLTLRSQDVIHSLFIPNMRFKQDAVPGLAIHMHFKPTQVGEYEIACAELCGLGHYKMHGILKVVSEQDWAKWQDEHKAEAAQ